MTYDMTSPVFCHAARCMFSARSRLKLVVVESISAGFQYELPAAAGLMPPSVPFDPAMFRSPLSSGFVAVAEFGFAMLTKCELVVVIGVLIVMLGVTGSS